MILHYTYPNNIKKYFAQKKMSYDEDILDIIVSSILQSEEFFKISQNVSLNISQIILYYGAINLFNGILTLIHGEELPINTHGISLQLPLTTSGGIGSINSTVINAKRGAIHNFYNIIENEGISIEGFYFSFAEILSSVPDLKHDFENCYEKLEPHCIPVEKLNVDGSLIERISTNELKRFKNGGSEIFTLIRDFDTNYLDPQKPSDDYFILRRKIKSLEIGLFNGYGQKFFQLGLRKNRKIIHLPQSVVLLMGLYVLASLARYHPKTWNPFIKNDSTGERQIIDKFLNICRRNIPNLLLNKLNSKTLIFIKTLEEETIIKKSTEKDELREFIAREVRNIMRKR